MSLDLYAGPLARYYSRDWETPQQRFAREQGMAYEVAYVGEPPTWLTREEAVAKVEEFRATVAAKVGEKVAGWSEEHPSYLAHQLHAKARDALLLVAAYNHRKDLDRPKTAPPALAADPAYAEASQRGYYLGPMAILEAHIFLPSDENKIFLVRDPMGREQVVTTTSNLRYALETLASEAWASHVEPSAWFARGDQAPGKVLLEKPSFLPWNKKWVEVDAPAVDDVVRYDAEYAFGCFAVMLPYAETHQVPLRTDA